jgi:hypothetical protein
VQQERTRRPISFNHILGAKPNLENQHQQLTASRQLDLPTNIHGANDNTEINFKSRMTYTGLA